MRLKPENGNILCRAKSKAAESVCECGVTYEKEGLATYEVVEDGGSGYGMKPGDLIMCDSTGTRLAGGGIDTVLFRPESVVCRILDK